MKSLKELEEIRQRALESVNLRKERNGTRIVVGMGTCGLPRVQGRSFWRL